MTVPVLTVALDSIPKPPTKKEPVLPALGDEGIVPPENAAALEVPVVPQVQVVVVVVPVSVVEVTCVVDPLVV